MADQRADVSTRSQHNVQWLVRDDVGEPERLIPQYQLADLDKSGVFVLNNTGIRFFHRSQTHPMPVVTSLLIHIIPDVELVFEDPVGGNSGRSRRER